MSMEEVKYLSVHSVLDIESGSIILFKILILGPSSYG